MSARRRLVGSLVAATGVLGLWMFGSAGLAVAATPCGASGAYSVSGQTATCSYTSQGTEDTFTVPAGIGSVSVIAVGGQGSSATAVDTSLGANVVNTALPITGRGELWVDVGQDPVEGCTAEVGGLFDGANGGKIAACDSGGGGGSSALLTMPRATAIANSLLTGNASTDARLLVAGGGGGAGSVTFGGNAGDTTVTGAGPGECDFAALGGNGGVGPTDGTNGGGSSNCAGAGSATSGAAGGSDGGGGGGGGWFGGGGGNVDGGGGGGSSYGGAGPSAGITITSAPSMEAPEVTISYTLQASVLAATLVSDSSGKAPGTALADKATAIQTAVNADPQQKAIACADITNYLGLVKAQSTKKLSPANALLLSTDATNLAAKLGC